MAKVTKKSVRKSVKSKSQTSKSKPKGKAYMKSATTKQDKAYNTFQM